MPDRTDKARFVYRDPVVETELRAATYPYGAGQPGTGLQLTLDSGRQPAITVRLPQHHAQDLGDWIRDTVGSRRPVNAALNGLIADVDERDATISTLRDDLDLQTKAAFDNQAEAARLAALLQKVRDHVGDHGDGEIDVWSLRELLNHSERHTNCSPGLCVVTAPSPVPSRHAQEPDLSAEVDRLRTLVGNENQPGWDGCSRAEAIRQANEFHAELLKWTKLFYEVRDERDASAAVVRAAIAWRKAAADGDDPSLWADGSDLALIEAVDALPHIDEPAGERRAQESEPVPGAHDWAETSLLSTPMTACIRCGVVQRRDGKNGPCRGPVRVELREPAGESQASDPGHDPYTTDARLCDDTGMVSDERVAPGAPGTILDPDLTYRRLLNNLRGHTGLPPYEGAPFQCTGSAHLAREHIRCTSPAHAAPKLAQGGIMHHTGLAIVGEQPDGCVVPAERPIDLVDRTVPKRGSE